MLYWRGKGLNPYLLLIFNNKDMINWKSTKRDDLIISEIVKRANDADVNMPNLTNLQMDITAVHLNDVYLNLNRLLNFDNFNFFHDIYGITKNINRNTGKLLNGFLPRSSKWVR